MLSFEEIDKHLDYFFFEVGANVIPVESTTKRPKVEWKEWQNRSIPEELYEHWKRNGDFRAGYAVITGKLWRGIHRGKWLVCIDIDNRKGIEDFILMYSQVDRIQALGSSTMVVQHEDAQMDRAHVYYICEMSIPKRSGNNWLLKDREWTMQMPAVEVKSDGSTCVVGPGSIHKNGCAYTITGSKSVQVLNKEETVRLDDSITKIYGRYLMKPVPEREISDRQLSSDYSILSDELREIAKSMTLDAGVRKITEGSRNNTLISFCRSLLNNHYQSRDANTIKSFLYQVNLNLCDPPLPEREVESIWNHDLAYLQKDLANAEKSYRDYHRDPIQDSYGRKNLLQKIQDKKIAEFIINAAKKTIKREDSLVRLILYTGLSSYTKDPLNLGIIAPTSEGKTYAVTEVSKFLPERDVWMIGNMSPKVLIRNRGTLVDEYNQPIKQKITELNKMIKEAEKDQERKAELEVKRKSLYENSRVLIDLSNKILVFLESPHSDTWEILKPILSHDSWEIEHPYVYKTETKGLEVKHIVTRGWPSCIFCSAKDDSSWPMWPEIQSRFFIASPNMIKEKYQDSNILIAQKKGLPQLIQEQLVISKEEAKTAQECVLLLRDELTKNHVSSIWIPYGSILGQSLPAEKGTDVRITSRTFSLLSLITKINALDRPKLVYGNETLAISLFEDLEEVLKLTHNLSGLPSYKLEFFTGVFIPLYLSKNTPLEKDGMVEDRIAAYTNELADFYREKFGKTLTTDAIKKTYLTELKNNGLIDDFQSSVDRRKKGYYPIVDVKPHSTANEKEINGYYTNKEEKDNNMQFFRLNLSKNYNNIRENWLEVEIICLLKYGIGKTNRFKLLDTTDSEICICQFNKMYHITADLNRYFRRNENCIYSSKVFGNIIEL